MSDKTLQYEPTSDDFLEYRYAAGDYFNKCWNCGDQFIGDKRAHSCRPCAEKEWYKDQLCEEDGRTAYEIAEAANISVQLLSKYRQPHNQQPWVRLEKVLAALGYELEVVKK